ncbi:MAG: general secretion pathway protein GspB [Betaproteobacteria bacterium]|nr:general secretion pathway protein GspB [Betaproteobacteria bacterium]
MSYILDALRKSDQQRQRGVPPTLLAPQAAAVAPRRRVSVSYALLTAVLLGAGIVIGSLRPWQTEQPAPATESATVTKPLESNTVLSPASVPARPQVPLKSELVLPTLKSAPAERRPPTRPAGTGERRASVVAKPDTGATTHSTPREAVTAVPKETARAVPEKPAGAGPGDAAQEQEVMTIAELPGSIRQEIPTISISVHAYSGAPKDRLVGINDRVLREGEYLAPGLMLEQITLDGMILRYKGYRFRRGVR